MSTLLFLPGAENPAPGLAVAGLNLIIGLALICISLLDNPQTERLARTKLKSIEGTAIMELAKVEIAMADKKYKDKIVELDGECDTPTDREFDAVVIVAHYKSDPKKVIGRMVLVAFAKEEKDKIQQLITRLG